jgi:beta-glucosidase
MSTLSENVADAVSRVEHRIDDLLRQMTLAEKIGQMNQVHADVSEAEEQLSEAIRAGRIGAILNPPGVDTVNELQRIAVDESRLGIPLLVGRDVIHGFRTISPIPIAQAATWNPDLVEEAAHIAASEAAATGINWTFAPMIDITRDPRWGRVAESPGEDPYLACRLAEAMVRGFQGDDPASEGNIAACAKHFAGYGASESGKDYSATNIPENELRNIFLPPFQAAIEAGVLTLMPSFSDIDGVPATANAFLLREILRGEWDFDGLVVSDWGSVPQLIEHGLSADRTEAVLAAVGAGIDLEMASGTFVDQLEDLVTSGHVPESAIDAAVANILRVKLRLGLFENAYTEATRLPGIASDTALQTARQAALESIVLLKNDRQALPLDPAALDSLAVIGPLADDAYEQLGTWVFDGDPSLSVTPLEGIRSLVGRKVDVHYAQGLETSRSQSSDGFDEAVSAAHAADVAVLFLGEESILSGEAHCRANIDLPGKQEALIRRVRAAGKPVIAVIMAGRPLTLTNVVADLDAILYAWHPGTMGGAAIADLLFGVESPSGKLPITFPRMVGQVPIYYNHKNTGRPPSPGSTVLIDDIPVRAFQTSFGNTAYHLDAGCDPMWVFGQGLSYVDFEYSNLRTSADVLCTGETLSVAVDLRNAGDRAATEVVQLYVRDLVASVTRPVRELKGFRRVRLEPGQSVTDGFDLSSRDLSFCGRDNRRIVEPGEFHVWVGGSSATQLRTAFHLKDPE